MPLQPQLWSAGRGPPPSVRLEPPHEARAAADGPATTAHPAVPPRPGHRRHRADGARPRLRAATGGFRDVLVHLRSPRALRIRACDTPDADSLSQALRFDRLVVRSLA